MAAKGSFQVVKLQRSARATVCSHSRKGTWPPLHRFKFDSNHPQQKRLCSCRQSQASRNYCTDSDFGEMAIRFSATIFSCNSRIFGRQLGHDLAQNHRRWAGPASRDWHPRVQSIYRRPGTPGRGHALMAVGIGTGPVSDEGHRVRHAAVPSRPQANSVRIFLNRRSTMALIGNSPAACPKLTTSTLQLLCCAAVQTASSASIPALSMWVTFDRSSTMRPITGTPLPREVGMVWPHTSR